MFFFFKQKTAYEILACLEFRRVLFRSRLQLTRAARRQEHHLRVAARGRADDVEVAARLRDEVEAEALTRLERGRRLRHARSTERRAGKGCRSRWSPYH